MIKRFVVLKDSTLIKSKQFADYGQSAAEFAILVPVLLVLALGAIAISQVFHAEFAIRQAAREAARTGAEVGSLSGGDQVRTAKLRAYEVADSWGVNGSAIEVQILSGGGLGRGGNFSVKVSYDYVIPFDPSGIMGLSIGSEGIVHLESVASYRIQKYKSRWP